MLEGKKLILATKTYTKEKRPYSWFCLWQSLILFALCLFFNLYTVLVLLKFLLGIVQGAIIVRLFVIYHDYEHHTILQKSILAKRIMQALGIFMLAPESIWKRSHDFHHQQNSKLLSASIGSYPIITKSKFDSISTKDQRRYLRTRHPITILSGYMTMFFVGMCLRAFMADPVKHLDALVAMIVHIFYCLTILYFFGWIQLIVLVFLPFCFVGAIGAYLFFVQHNYPNVKFQSNADWTYEKAAIGSSSYMRMNTVMHWVTGNIGYHHIHHLNAHIPFYRLPEVLNAFPELQKQADTSWKWSDIKRCLQLKVWDEKKQQLVFVKARSSQYIIVNIQNIVRKIYFWKIARTDK